MSDNRDPVYPVARTTTQQKQVEQHYGRSRPDPLLARPPRYGYISKFFVTTDTIRGTAVMRVGVRFDDAIPEKLQSSYPRVFILGHTASEITTLYGDDLIGLRCRVEFNGIREDQGVVYIDNPEGRGNIDKMNNLPGFGTVFSPAGKS